MASPILHIKDAYYFEVPKFLWRPNYRTLEEVPEFLREAHPDATVEKFNDALAGKILIPQPFGELRNLYQAKSGFCISKFMIIEVIVAAILIFVFTRLAARMRTGIVPRGRAWNLLEAVLSYMRENVAKPAIGSHDADRFIPLLWTLFFFILGCNLFGLIPFAGSPTASFGVTLALAAIVLLTVFLAGMFKFGPIGFWLNQVPHMDLPWYMAPLKLVIFIIEVGGLLIRHAILAVRLLANMVAGHVVLLGIMGIAFTATAAASAMWPAAATISILGSTAFSMLELFVAFLQAYIFTFLAALFIGGAVHSH